jgi:hypothetical protein
VDLNGRVEECGFEGKGRRMCGFERNG